jgi:hypothetical protein
MLGNPVYHERRHRAEKSRQCNQNRKQRRIRLIVAMHAVPAIRHVVRSKLCLARLRCEWHEQTNARRALKRGAVGTKRERIRPSPSLGVGHRVILSGTMAHAGQPMAQVYQSPCVRQIPAYEICFRRGLPPRTSSPSMLLVQVSSGVTGPCFLSTVACPRKRVHRPCESHRHHLA